MFFSRETKAPLKQPSPHSLFQLDSLALSPSESLVAPPLKMLWCCFYGNGDVVCGWGFVAVSAVYQRDGARLCPAVADGACLQHREMGLHGDSDSRAGACERGPASRFAFGSSGSQAVGRETCGNKSPLYAGGTRAHGAGAVSVDAGGSFAAHVGAGARYGADARSSVTRLRALFSKRVTVNETHRARLADRGRTAPGGTPRSTHPEPGPVPQRLPPLLLAPSWLSCFRTASRSYSLLS